MYKINLEKYAKLLTWSSIYWGIQKSIIKPESAIQYANKIVEVEPHIDNPEIIELLITDTQDREAILSLINNIIGNNKDKEKSSLKILRYAILSDVQKNAKNNQDLLEKAEDIYADFNYPSDMECFISYMPVQDDQYNVSEHTTDENEQRLIDKFNIFISNEYEWLKKELSKKK
ncbi:MAG: DUF2247 family protein [Bacillota bacterium]|nr:DUF2247 family protein [Bacillota bacterium]